MDSAPENRARTVGLCKRLGIWPLDSKHREGGHCLCVRCFTGEPKVVELAPKRKARPAFAWEDGYEAA